MTEAATLPTRRTGPSLAAVVTTALCSFLMLVVFLAWQLQAGQDPALGTVIQSAPARTAKAGHHKHSHVSLVTRTSGGGVVR